MAIRDRQVKESRIEPMTRDYLDQCARLLVSAFNARPWNEPDDTVFYLGTMCVSPALQRKGIGGKLI